MHTTRLRTTGFSLKVFAIVGMTANHVAHVFSPMLDWQVTLALYSLGGITYPIMAYLIVEGYRHTSNLRKYAARLLVFAVVAQVPFWLCFGWPSFGQADSVGLNLDVLFTLLIGLGLLWVWDHSEGKRWQFALSIVLGVALSSFCDWAWQGPIIVVLFYVLRSRGRAGIWLTMLIPYATVLLPALTELSALAALGFSADATLTATSTTAATTTALTTTTATALAATAFLCLCNIGYALVGFTLAAVALCHYDGRRGRPLKWFFYVYYPLHLLVIWALYQALLVL